MLLSITVEQQQMLRMALASLLLISALLALNAKPTQAARLCGPYQSSNGTTTTRCYLYSNLKCNDVGNMATGWTCANT